MDDVDERRPELGVDLGARIPFVAEQEQRPQQVIEASTARPEDDDPGGSERHRLVERELQVGCVLRRRVRVDPSARRARRREAVGRNRVEVTDRDVHLEAEGPGAVDAAVGGDHRRASRSRCIEREMG